jgi:hypothetical protein
MAPTSVPAAAGQLHVAAGHLAGVARRTRSGLGSNFVDAKLRLIRYEALVHEALRKTADAAGQLLRLI